MEPLGDGDPLQVGRYQIQARLGSGGMGRVYLASSPGGRLVAAKVIHPELARDQAFLTRFWLEVAAARKVGGAYTAPVVDVSSDGEEPPWLVTAFVPGPSLASMVAAHGALSAESVWRLAGGLVEALAVIHEHGLVHRDLKPPNVLLAPDGPQVIDFGISRALDATAVTAAGTMVGTPSYISPEQAEGAPAGQASDVFALGCVLAYAATGKGPFGEGTPAGIIYRIVHSQPPLDGVSGPLRELITRCLAKDAADRATLTELMDRITARPSSASPGFSFWPPDVADWIASYQAGLAAIVGTGSEPRDGGTPASPRPALPAASHPNTAVTETITKLQPAGGLAEQAGTAAKRRPVRHRSFIGAAAVAAVVVLAAGGAATGWAVGRSHPRVVTRVVSRTVTRSVTVTRWHTRWRTRTVTVPGGVRCLEQGGHVWFAGGAAGTPGGGGPVTTTCTITPVPPYAYGIIAVNAVDGTSGGDYQPVPGG